jgi:hypothetical protein
MREFSVLEFAEHLVAIEVTFHTLVHRSLEDCLKVLKKDMKAQIGDYQDAAGPYGAWQPLADETELEKAHLGAPANAPLERFGNLKKSFKYETDGLVGVVGSTDPVMVEHEYGTKRMPPRPVVGPALWKNRDHIRGLCAAAVIETLTGTTINRQLIKLQD